MALAKVREEKPTRLIGSPMCRAFSNLQTMNFSRMDREAVRRLLAHGIMHLKFCIILYRLYSILYGLYTICMACTASCMACNTLYGLYSILYSLYSILCGLYSILYGLHTKSELKLEQNGDKMEPKMDPAGWVAAGLARWVARRLDGWLASRLRSRPG